MDKRSESRRVLIGRYNRDAIKNFENSSRILEVFLDNLFEFLYFSPKVECKFGKRINTMLKTGKTKSKKRKVGTILDESVIRIIKERALKEGKTMSDIIQEAVVEYAVKEENTLKERREAARRLFEGTPSKLSLKELQELMEWDMYDTESE